MAKTIRSVYICQLSEAYNSKDKYKYYINITDPLSTSELYDAINFLLEYRR